MAYSIEDITSLIIGEAKAQGVDPYLALAVAEQESGFNPNARSKKNATGLFQLMPDTQREMGVSDPYDPIQNVRGGIGYLKKMINRYDGDIALGLAAYNAGAGNVDRHGGIPPFKETMDYVRKITGAVRGPDDGSWMLEALDGKQGSGVTDAGDSSWMLDAIKGDPRSVSKEEPGVFSDLVHGAAKGAGQLVQAAGWLTGSDTVEELGRNAAEYWTAGQSSRMKSQIAEVDKAEGFWNTLVALKDNPAAFADMVVGSLPMMVPGMAVGSLGARGIAAFARNAASSAAIKAGAGEAVAMQAGNLAARKSIEAGGAKWFAMASNVLGEGAVSGGAAGSDVEKFALEHGATESEAKDAAKWAALKAGASTALVAGIGAKFETEALLGKLTDKGFTGAAKNIGREAAEEGLQNPAEEYFAYEGKVKFDPNQTYDFGKSVATGLATGGLMGGGFHAAGRASNILAGEEQQAQSDDALTRLTSPDSSSDVDDIIDDANRAIDTTALDEFINGPTPLPPTGILARDAAQGGFDSSAISQRNQEAMFRESLAEQGQSRQADINELEALVNDETADVDMRRAALVSLQAQKRDALDNAFRSDALALPSPNDPTGVLRVTPAGEAVPETRQQKVDAERARITAGYRPSGNVDERGINGTTNEGTTSLATDSRGGESSALQDSVPDSLVQPGSGERQLHGVAGGTGAGVRTGDGSNLVAGKQSSKTDAVNSGQTRAANTPATGVNVKSAADITLKKDGTPFTLTEATFELKAKGQASTHSVVMVGGGFGIRANAVAPTAQPAQTAGLAPLDKALYGTESQKDHERLSGHLRRWANAGDARSKRNVAELTNARIVPSEELPDHSDHSSGSKHKGKGTVRRVTKQEFKLLQWLGKLSGQRFVLVEGANITSDQFTIPGDKSKTVYVNADASSLISVLVGGHETTHLALETLRTSTDPEDRAIAKTVDDFFEKNLTGEELTKYRDYYSGKGNLSDADMREEAASDIGGNLHGSPQFYTKLFAAIDKEHGVSGIEKFMDAFRQAWEMLAKFLRGDRFTTSFVADIDKANEVVEAALLRYYAKHGGMSRVKAAQDVTIEAKYSPRRQSVDQTPSIHLRRDDLQDNGPEYGNWTVESVEKRTKPVEYLDARNEVRVKHLADMDQAEISYGSGLPVAYIYWLKNKQTGEVRPFGNETAYKALGISSERANKVFDEQWAKAQDAWLADEWEKYGGRSTYEYDRRIADLYKTPDGKSTPLKILNMREWLLKGSLSREQVAKRLENFFGTAPNQDIQHSPRRDPAFGSSEEETIGGFQTKTAKDGSVMVYGNPEDIRAATPEGVKGTVVNGDGVRFTRSDAPRVKGALAGSKTAYSRQGVVNESIPMKDGKYVGAPEKFNTPRKIGALRAWLHKLAVEGTDGRFWYENSSREVLRMVGGDKEEARKFVALLSIYSPQMRVAGNTTAALRAWSQYKAGEPIQVKTGVQDAKAEAAMSNVEAFWSGEKTGNFYTNLLSEIDADTKGKQGATIDMWMMRAAQYDTDAPLSSQYAFMENETNRIARDLGWEPQQVQAAIWVAMKARMENPGVKAETESSSQKRKWIRYDAKGKRVILNADKHWNNWLKHAFDHEPTSEDTQLAKFDFSDGLLRHLGQISFEARPGRTTGVLPGIHDAAYEQQMEFQSAIDTVFLDESGNDMLAAKLGLLVDGNQIMPGVWQEDVSPSLQTRAAMAPSAGGKIVFDRETGEYIKPAMAREIDPDWGDNSRFTTHLVDPAQKKLLNTYAAIKGFLLRQEGVGWHRPFYVGSKVRENGVDIDVGRPLTNHESKKLSKSIGDWMITNGKGKDWNDSFAIISSHYGVRLVNFGVISNSELHQQVVQIADKVLPDAVGYEGFASDGDMPTNNWKENPNGRQYILRISAEGSSDVLRWSRDIFADRLQSVFDEFSRTYGWGNPGQIPEIESAEELGVRQEKLYLKESTRRMSPEDRQGLAAAYRAIVPNAELFRHKKSDSKDFAEIAKTIAPWMALTDISHWDDSDHKWRLEAQSTKPWRVMDERETAIPGTIAAQFETRLEAQKYVNMNGGASKYSVSESPMATAYVTQNGDGIEINAIGWGEDKGGSHIYSIVGNYAHNNGLTFYGDSQGITEAGMRRRLENMVSLSLKFGGTDFIRPHSDMVHAWPEASLIWDEGKDNLPNLLAASYHVVSDLAPEIKRITFNLEEGGFYHDNGSPATNDDFDAIAKRLHSGAYGEGTPGSGTLKIAVLTRSLVQRANQDGWGSVLAQPGLLSRKSTWSEVANTRASTRRNKAFTAWAGTDRPVVEPDEINDFDFSQAGPFVVRGFHGTTNTFKAFNAGLKGNIEGQFGAVNYFTSSEQDAEENYAGEGPDLTQRIELEAEQLVYEIEDTDDAELLKQQYGEDVYDEDATTMARNIARKKLHGGEEKVMEVFIRTDNPFVVGDVNSPWYEFFDEEQLEADAIEQVADNNGVSVDDVKSDWDTYTDEIDEARYEIMDGQENELVKAVQTVAARYDFDPSDLLSSLYDISADGSARHNQLEQFMRQNESLSYAEGPDDGALVQSQMIGEVIQEMGFDSIILKNADVRFKNMNMGRGTAHIHVFDADNTNIKSATDNSGKYDRTNPDIYASTRRSTFYSPLTDAIKQAPKMDTSTGANWRIWLTSNTARQLGVKAEEVEWTGISDWLGMRSKEKITRQQVLDFLAANVIRTTDVRLGGESVDPENLELPPDMSVREIDEDEREISRARQINDYVVEDSRGYLMGIGRTAQEAIQDAYDGYPERFEVDRPKYSTYVPEGGVDGTYVETLVTFPDLPPSRKPEAHVVEDAESDPDYPFKVVVGGRVVNRWISRRSAEESLVDEQNKSAPNFKSSHWDDRNVLVHIRTDEVEGEDGKRYLRLIEVRSDWGQKGRDQGFAGEKVKAYQVSVNGRPVSSYETHAEAMAHVERASKYNNRGDISVAEVMVALNDSSTKTPKAPFVTDTQSWVALGVKKAIAMAVDAGLDGVVVVTGKQSADLYDLSKSVDSIAWRKNGQTGKTVAIEMPNGSSELLVNSDGKVIGSRGGRNALVAAEGKQLDVVIGKEISKQVMAEDEGNLTGDGLEIGGEGMLKFYDEIVPQVTNKVLKKIGGGKIASVDITTGDAQPGFPITDTMREQVTGKGLPLFSPRRSGAVFDIADETRGEKFVRTWQDNVNHWQSVQNQIKEQGGDVGVYSDVYAAMKRYPGRVGEHIANFTRHHVEPLLERMAKLGTDMEEIGTYLYALHAKDRNAYISGIRGDMPGNGSGLDDGEAQMILDDYRKNHKNFAEFESLALDFQDLTNQKLDMLVKWNVISQDQADAMTGAMGDHYVPLKGFEKVDEAGNRAAGGNGAGRGYSTNKKLDKRAYGRVSRAGNVVENIIRDYERAILASEKANVGRYLKNLVEQNPDNTLWTVDRTPMQPTIRQNGVVMMPKQFDAENEVQFIENGKPIRIQLHDPLLASTYNNLGTEMLNSVLKMSGNLNAYLRQMWTSKNPAFFLINPIRDIQTSVVMNTGQKGAAFAGRALLNLPAALKAAYAYERNDLSGLSTEMKELLKVYGNMGARTGAAFIDTIEAKTLKLQESLNRHGGNSVIDEWRHYGAKSAIKLALFKTFNNKLFDVIEQINGGFENMTRLATFKAYIDSQGGLANLKGMQRAEVLAEAGRLAKNVTVDFNTHGEQGRNANALYLFFNANVQGTANVAKAVATSAHRKQVWAAIGGMVTLGFALALMGDDDDDSLTPDHIKQRNLVFTLNGTRYQVPMPYGFSHFVDLGRLMGDVTMGRKDTTKASLYMASSFLANFSPLGDAVKGGEGDSADAVLSLVPTVLKPPVMVGMNRGPFGNQLMPEYPGQEDKADRGKMWRSTRGSVYDSIANDMIPWADVSPETLKTYWSYITGGAGRFVVDGFGAAVNAGNGEFDVEKTPIVNKFVGLNDVEEYRQRFYEQAKEIATAKRLAKEGEPVENKRILALSNGISGIKDRMKALADKTHEARLSGDTAAAKEYEARQVEIARRFNERFRLANP